MQNKNRYIGFNCPAEIHEWLKNKGEREFRNLTSSILHALQTVKNDEEKAAKNEQS